MDRLEWEVGGSSGGRGRDVCVGEGESGITFLYEEHGINW